MRWAAFILLAIVGCVVAVRWFVNANPARMARRLRQASVWLILLLVVALAIAARLPWLLGLLLPLAPLGIRMLTRGRPADGWDNSTGQRSDVTTDYLHMTFDHDSGELDGRVTAGSYAGRLLSEMSMPEVTALLDEVARARDSESSSILTSYLDRTFGDSWRTESADSGAGGNSGGPMTRDEAWRVLGLPPDSSEGDIRSAHRRLMKQLHPDHGGSDYLAAKINEAKDVLLGR